TCSVRKIAASRVCKHSYQREESDMIRYAVLAAVCGAAVAAHGQNVIDQNQPNAPDYMAGFAQGDLAQSFQPGAGNVSGAGIFLQAGVGSTDNVTISLYDALPNAGGNLL